MMRKRMGMMVMGYSTCGGGDNGDDADADDGDDDEC